jgi:osmotically inducible protein OsmC
MEAVYRTKAVSTGGRNGKVAVENSPLAFDMAPPPEMGGGSKTGTNPEQLFAAGYSACFGSALQHVIRVKKMPVPAPTVELTVGIGKEDGGYKLTADITGIFSGVDQETADALIREAHTVCPYSKATMGNIDVTLTAKIK